MTTLPFLRTPEARDVHRIAGRLEMIPGLARELALDPRTIRALKANADLNLTHPTAERDQLFGIPFVEAPLPDDVLAVVFNRLPNGLPDVEGMVVVKRGGRP